MRLRLLHLSGILALAVLPGLSCDDVDAGQLADDPGPPVLAKILIQDELPSGGRNTATDLLDKSPVRKCSESEPCPTGDKFSRPPCNLVTRTCPHPLRPDETPPAVGIPPTPTPTTGGGGGNQFRFVMSKRLEGLAKETIVVGAMGRQELVDPTLVALLGPDGKEMTTYKYWDSIGSPNLTSDLFVNPHGPAVVMKTTPSAQLLPLTSYTLRIKPEAFKDSKGQAVTRDINGEAVATSYPFFTEGLHPAGGQLFEDEFKGVIDVKDVLAIKISVRINPSTLKVVVKRKGGEPVESVGALEFGTDLKLCYPFAENARQINVFRISGEDRIDWEPGEYTVSVEAVATDNRMAVFSRDPFGKEPFVDYPFSAKANVDKDKAYLAKDHFLPWECQGPRPTDVGVIRDMAMPKSDLAVPRSDMAKPSDGGVDMPMALDARVGG